MNIRGKNDIFEKKMPFQLHYLDFCYIFAENLKTHE